jgi:hypothetical protein
LAGAGFRDPDSAVRMVDFANAERALSRRTHRARSTAMRHSTIAATVSLGLALGLAACGQTAQQASPPPAQPAPAATPAVAPAAPSVADLVGARAAGGESTMQARGYTVARTQGLTAYWWHPAGNCVRVVTANGRYSVVQQAAASNCGK